MDFEHRGLHERDQTVEVVDADQLLDVGRCRVVDEVDRRVEALPGVLLEELFALDPAPVSYNARTTAPMGCLPGDWNGRLAPAFELVFHFNRQARRPNKIIPCRWAGHVNSSHGGMRAKDGTVGEWQHAGQGVQESRIPDSVLRITRHKARGIETEHPAVFPVALPEFLMRAYADEGDVVFEPFSGSGTTILAGQRTGRRVRAIELAPAYVDLAIARWRMLHPDLPVTLADDARDYDAVAASRAEALADAA